MSSGIDIFVCIHIRIGRDAIKTVRHATGESGSTHTLPIACC